MDNIKTDAYYIDRIKKDLQFISRKHIIINMLFVIVVSLLCGCGNAEVDTHNNEELMTSNTVDNAGEVDETNELVAPDFTITYDVVAKKISVIGTQNYSSLHISNEVQDRGSIEVQDDDFILVINSNTLNKAGYDTNKDLGEMLERTDRSFHFINEYIAENAESVYSDYLEGRDVVIYLSDDSFGYSLDQHKITLKLNSSVTHREFMYLLALMSDRPIGWEQMGYAWYVATCLDPYNELRTINVLTQDEPYYSACIDKGINPDNMSVNDYRIMYDAISYVALEKGLNHWGSQCESVPVSSESVFTRKEKQEGDDSLSAFMAASFVGWLDDKYGFEKTTEFSFGQIDFEDAFDTNLLDALDEWKNYVVGKLE